jgi:hypothetical protein
MVVEVQRINKRSSDKNAALLRPVLCLTVKEVISDMQFML